MVNQQLRVLLHPYFFFAEAWNGIDEHLLLLAKYLDRRQFELIILAHDTDGPQTGRLAERAGMRMINAPYRPGAGARRRLSALRTLYAAERIDLVHFHSPAAGGQAVAALAARLAGVPATLATYHQIQARQLPPRSRAINSLAHLAFVDDTIAVSQGVKASLVRAAGLPRHRIRVIHNGIDPPCHAAAGAGEPARASNEIRVGYFGRLSPEKGVSGLLDALALLAERDPRVRTLIVGDGPERAALEARAQQLALSDRVQFLGFRPDARRIMAQVDIVVHVPIYEGFGLVALEAMACGRPIVASDAPGGLPDIVVDGETGLLIPVGSPSATAAALARLAADPAERARLGRNGQARYERHFTAQEMAARTGARYWAALGRRAAAGPRAASPRSQLAGTR